MAFDNSDPTLTAEIPADTLTRARIINAYAYPGLPPARIVQLAEEKMAQQEAAAQAEDIDDDEDDAPDLPGESPDSFGDADGGPFSDGEEGDVELDRETEDELIRQLRGADALLPQAPREGQTVAQKPDKKTRTLFEQLATEFERARKLGIRRFIPPATRHQFDSLVEALPTGKEREELLMAMTPVAGEMQSAREAIDAFARFGSSVAKGNAGEAATAAAEGIIGLIGVIPLIGTVGRAGKAVGKSASARIKHAGKGKAVKAAPSAGILAEKTAPRFKLSRSLKRELKELHLERDRIKTLRLEAPPGSKGRAALLKQQRRIQLEINKKVGKAFEKQVLDDLEKQGFRVIRGPKFRTPEGWRRPDAAIVNEKSQITDIVEIKSGRARLNKAQESKDEFLAQELGVRKILIREKPPTKFTSIRRSPKGRR